MKLFSIAGISHKIVNLKQKEQQTIPLLPNVIQELARGQIYEYSKLFRFQKN